MSKTLLQRVALTLFLGLAATGAKAAAWGSINGEFGPSSFSGPHGWTAMCARDPALCRPAGRLTAAHLSVPRLRELKRVNREVNTSIVPIEEPAGQDRWEVRPYAGDCDDYALTKREALIRAGWPPASLRFATLFTEEDEYHLVLLVETDQGTVVMDNRFAEVARWNDLSGLGYRWIAVERLDRRGWRLSRRALAITAEIQRRSQTGSD